MLEEDEKVEDYRGGDRERLERSCGRDRASVEHHLRGDEQQLRNCQLQTGWAGWTGYRTEKYFGVFILCIPNILSIV